MATGDNPWPLTRKQSIAEISPDIQDLGPALTPSQTYLDAGLDAALANLTTSQARALDSLNPLLFARVEGNLPSLSDSIPPSPKWAHPTISLPAKPPLENEDSASSGNSTPTAPAPTPWTPTHLNEVFDRALPPVSMPHASDDDLPPSPDVADFHATTLVAADEVNLAFCRYSCYFLTAPIEFLPDPNTSIPISSDTLDKAILIVSSVLDLGVGSHCGRDCEVI